jgi:hypothetical protein
MNWRNAAMAISANVRHYFLEAYTPCGHISLIPDLTAECQCTYILKGNSGLDKSTFIKLTGIQMSDRRYDVDYIRQADDPDSLAGLFLSGTGICLLDSNSVNSEAEFRVSTKQLSVSVDLEECLHKPKWESKKQEILAILQKQRTLEKERDDLIAGEYPSEEDDKDPLPIQSLLEQMVQSELPYFFQNYKCMEETNGEEIRRILSIVKKNKVSFCFLHALQNDGWANYAPRYLRNFDRICVDQDGSDGLWHDILNEIKSLGQKIEVILHPINPFQVIGIIFPWKNLAVWKGNPVELGELGLKKQHSAELSRVLEELRYLRQSLKSLGHECVSVHRLDEVRNDLISHVLGQVQGW